MNVAYTVTAFPAGVAADRFDQRTLLLVGLGMLAAADIALAAATRPLLALTGSALAATGGHGDVGEAETGHDECIG